MNQDACFREVKDEKRSMYISVTFHPIFNEKTIYVNIDESLENRLA